MAATPAERMRSVRTRRRAEGKREIRLVVPDTRTEEVRNRIEQAVAGLDENHEADAIAWAEAVAVAEDDGAETR